MEKVIITTPEQLRELFRQELKIFAEDLPPSPAIVEDKWLDIDELIDYLPGKPAKATLYGYVSKGEIPSHKSGKRLVFLKNEIDKWLKSKRRKTAAEIAEEAEKYISGKRKTGGRR